MEKFSLISENNSYTSINSIKLDSELVYISENGKQVGSLILCYSQGKANVFSVAILEKYRGKGYSKKLMYSAIDIAKHRGCYIMELNTEVTNEVANNLYKSIGFDFKGIMDEYNNYTLIL